MSNDLGPMPEPQIEPGETSPGGADAVDLDPGGEPTIPNLPTDKNPAVDDDETPDEVKQGEDTATEATASDGGESDDDGTGESTA
jgi:hypothetical protein